MSPNESSGQGSNLWALLVGIDEYLNVRDLLGAVNDVEAVRIFLQNQMGVPEKQIRVLKNGEATRAGILDAFQSFLIDNDKIKHSDQILFHYSGHGSQMRDHEGIEPDGYNECLVPHDSRTGDVFDIPDKTLAAMLDRLAQAKGNNITVVLDCCHSGSGTRKAGEPLTEVTRRVPADDRIPPPDLDAGIMAGVARRSAGPSGWGTEGVSHVLLAACRDYEEANEYWSDDEEGGRAKFGALTHFLLKALSQTQEQTVSYAELHERVATQVNTRYPDQMPQCEGDRDRELFGGRRILRDPFIVVTKVDADKVTLGAGLVHGLRKESELALYGAEVRTRAEVEGVPPLATVKVSSVSATTAEAEVTGDPPAEPIQVGARAVVTKQVYAGLRQKVILLPAEGAEDQDALDRLRQAIESGPDGSPSPYVTLVTEPAQADLRVTAKEGALCIINADGEQLVAPEEIKEGGKDVRAVLGSLESIVRFQRVITLQNEEPGSQLVGKIEVGLRQYVEGTPPAELTQVTPDKGGDLTLTYYPDDQKRNLYVAQVTNHSTLDVYPYLFLLSPDYSITPLYPVVAGEQKLTSGLTLNSGFDSPKERMEIYLPPGWDSSRDRLKVIVTTAASSLDVLAQPGLNIPPTRAVGKRAAGSALDNLVDSVVSATGTRFARPAQTAATEDWATVELSFTVVHDHRQTALTAPAGRFKLGDNLVLEKPEGVEGTVTVTTWTQATRAAQGDPDLKPPPGLEAFPELYQPVGREGTRSVGSASLVLGLDLDDESRGLITPDNPLRLHLPEAPGEEVADLLPIIFDGEDYLLAGYSSDGRAVVELVDLPPVSAPTRGMGRTLRLFLYKKMGRHIPEFGLRNGVAENGKVLYTPVSRDQFRPGDRVAILVHGFKDDTSWFVKNVAPMLVDKILPYDHMLAWDYETWGTSVQESGEDFARALRQQCGFVPGDGITVHVYAHSMGTLVSRAMIELSGGHEMVDGLCLAGPPNNGSTLINVAKGAAFLVMTALNHATKIPAIGKVSWPLKELFKAGEGFADLAVNSPITRTLNGLTKPDNVPYLVLAGKNLPDELASRFNRLAYKVFDTTLDAIFGEDNDTAIGLSSLRGVRGEAYPKLTIKELPCDHSGYYVISQGREAIREWVAGLE